MGHKPRQANPEQASAAFTGASGAAQGLQGLSSQNQAQANALYRLLFGGAGPVPQSGIETPTGAPGEQAPAGILSRFLDPNLLNVDRPTGVYGLQYNRAIQDIAQNFQNQRGALARYLANRGFGAGSPSGFEADLARRLGQAQADTQGRAFTQYAARAYEDALRNFWGATGLASGQLGAARNAALGAGEGAAGTYSRLYGTASQPVGSSGIGSSLIRAGGNVAGAAAACPAEGALILMADGSEKPVEQLHKGDRLAAVDGGEEQLLEDPEPQVAVATVQVELNNGLVARSSSSHTLLRKAGGYVRAGEAHGAIVKTVRGPAMVFFVRPVEAQKVYRLRLDRSHTYRADGIWAEE